MATWSKTRAKLEKEYLAESLKGRIQYFALLDRRVGKRRLISLKEEMKNELDWVYYFYQVRLEAEGLI